MLSFRVDELVDAGIIDSSWGPVLSPVQTALTDLAKFLEREQEQGWHITPNAVDIFRALRLPRDKVRVLIVGQDPYPTAGDAMGLAFSTRSNHQKIPASLHNIFRELHDDVGVPYPSTGDVSGWSNQGVLLLNRVLTTRVGFAGAHRNKGWERVTDAIIASLDAPHLVVILWGNDAQKVRAVLDSSHVISSAHPSPLSAHRGFFGSRPFSQVNRYFEELGQPPMRWELSGTLVNDATGLRGHGALRPQGT